MDFSYSDEQQMLRDGVSKYLEKSYDFDARQNVVRSEAPWSADAWAQYAEFGLLALPFSEEAGGLGGSVADTVAVCELLGRHLTVEPYVMSIALAGRILAESGNEQATELLEKLMAGEATVAFAYEEGTGTPSPDHIAMTAEPSGDGYVLDGEKRLVLAGTDADAILVVARAGPDGPLVAFIVAAGAQGVDARSYTTIDGRSAANIRFEGVQVAKDAVLLAGSGDVLESIIADAMIALAAEAVGAMGALLALTSEYAFTRKQFGVAIGTFQVVAHRLSDMKIAYMKARSTLLYTTALAASGAVSKRDLAILKGQTGKLGLAIGEAAIQTHGGVGMTDELSVSHFHKRLLAIDTMFGPHQYHLRTVGSMAGKA